MTISLPLTLRRRREGVYLTNRPMRDMSPLQEYVYGLLIMGAFGIFLGAAFYFNI